MKSTEKFVEIMEKLTGVSVGSQVTFKENTYEVSTIDTEDLSAKVTLKCEGQEDIEIDLKDLVESEDHVVEVCKKSNEEMDKEGDMEDKKDDKESGDKEDDKESDAEDKEEEKKED